MKKKDLELPIFINENDEVVDGQHTLEARKELNKPIRYIRGKFEDEFDVAEDGALDTQGKRKRRRRRTRRGKAKKAGADGTLYADDVLDKLSD